MEQQVKIRLTPAWRRFIYYVYTECPNGEVSVKIVNSQPTKLLKAQKDIRFDKQGSIPLEPAEETE